MGDHKKAVRRFGARYGTTIRNRLAEVESMQKRAYECPSCHQEKVKRVAAGIWECRKCGAKFAGKAYTISKKIKIKEEIITSTDETAPKKRRRLHKREKEESDEQEEQ